MDCKERYLQWLDFDEKTREELIGITDEKEIEDRFYKDLAFGTGGLRGIMGAGANRMNYYTVSKATKGLADYLLDKSDGKRMSVAIGYDVRNNSSFFAHTAASVLNANGIKTYVFDTVMPTPVLSFAVRYKNCDAGIVLTASHNPKEYNGYKVYNRLGCQLSVYEANDVIKFVNAVTDLKGIDHTEKDEAVKSGLFEYMGGDVLDAFISEVKTQSLYDAKSDLKIVYTPLHGTGNIPVRRILEGFDVSVVKEQELPDGNFSTVRSPNPEEKDALTLAIEQAKREKADLVIGTDPDSDRIGISVRHNGEYPLITGNQVGALLAKFVLSRKKERGLLNEKSTLVTTIVTSPLGAEIAKSYGLKVEFVLTGFKNICGRIEDYEKTGENEFVMGYEESYGYLVGSHARDKDAVVSSLLVAEMTAYYKDMGMTLVDALDEIYSEYGFCLDSLETFVLKGKDGAEKIQSLMRSFRADSKSLFADVDYIEDYLDGFNGLPPENVLKFYFKDKSFAAVRPSGTEPKLKVYFSIRGENEPSAKARLESIKAVFDSVVNG
ncbi:MAG: phospho-sugar mutase [Clostridia bacterium]|nr:phospho-sugar mutase [Clostridia bacterium]